MSGIVKGLFGGRSKGEKILSQFSPVGFSSAGFSGRFNKESNTFDLTRTGEQNEAIDSLRQSFASRSEAFGRLKERVRPGFGELTRTRIDAIRRAGSRAVGNLREELATRRVQGSSFGQNLIASEEARFGQLEEQTRAEAKLQELGLTAEFVNQETAAAIEGAQAVLQQMNFETGLSAGLSQSTSQQVQANLMAQAEARAASEGGFGNLLGTVIGAVAGGPIGAAIGNKIFKPKKQTATV